MALDVPTHSPGATSRAARAPTEDLRYRAVTDLCSLRPEWARLYRSLEDRAFYHRWRWHDAIRAHLFDDVVYHCFYDPEALVGLFPMRRPGRVCAAPEGTTLETPSHPEIFLADALVHPRHATDPWAEILLSRVTSGGAASPRRIRFGRVPAGSCLRSGLSGPSRHVREIVVGRSAWCDCSAPSRLRTLSKAQVHNVHRLHSRAERTLGPVEVRTMLGREAATSLDLFMRVEEAGWKGPTGLGTSLSCTPTAAAFYKTVLKGFGETDDARVDVLTIDGRPAATQLGVRAAGTWNLLKIGFDEAFASVGPGNLLMHHFFEAMSREPGVTTVSLVTAPDWAERWHLRSQATYDVDVFAGGGGGRVLRGAYDARRLLGRVKRRLLRGRPGP